MDALDGLLDGVRARGAFVLRMSLEPPWSMRIEDRAPLTLICTTAGSAVLVAQSGRAHEVHAGDVAVVRGTEDYVFADDAGTRPQVVIHSGNRCTTLRGDDLSFEMSVGVRTWGNSATGADRSVIATYASRGEVGARLLDALPTAFVLRAEDWRSPLVELLDAEAARGRPGQDAYLDRLLDLLLLDVLREWFDRPGNAPAWWLAERDPMVGRALKLIHHGPGHPWTVASLAAAVDGSRALFARRFTERVGEPPIAFLTGWRLAVAADALRSSDRTVASIARDVGYATPFAFSNAFKRRFGVSPTGYRAGSSDVAAG